MRRLAQNRLHRLDPVGALAHEVDVRDAGEQRPHAVARERVVVDDDDAQTVGHRALGSSAYDSSASSTNGSTSRATVAVPPCGDSKVRSASPP